MERATRRQGDKAAILMGVGGCSLLALEAFAKGWVGRHVSEFAQVIDHGGPTSWALVALVVGLVGTWVAGSVVGIVLAYPLRRHASLRYAAVAAALGIVAATLTNTGMLPRTARWAWSVLVWLPTVATLVVLAASACWLRGRLRGDRGPTPERFA